MARLVALAILLALVPGSALAIDHPGCRPIPREEMLEHPDWYPTGVKGCVVYGVGTASHWGGPGVARNDCLWPWTACTPIRITSLDTGRSITVQPTMYGDLYTTTADERIADLDPAAVRALGLDWNRGLYRVRVGPVGKGSSPSRSSHPALPDTALTTR